MTILKTISTADLDRVACLVTNAQGAQATLARLLYATAEQEGGEGMAAEVWVVTTLGERLEEISEALGDLIRSSRDNDACEAA